MVPNIHGDHGDLSVRYMENQGKELADDSVTARSSSFLVLWALDILSLMRFPSSSRIGDNNSVGRQLSNF